METKYQEIQGDLIKLALAGEFDVIAHGCNCFCTMNGGIAVAMKNVFNCNDPDYFPSEDQTKSGDVNKLGTIEFYTLKDEEPELTVVNAYTQYGLGSNWLSPGKVALDYEALTLCMRKMNKLFAGKYIGLPQIGAGLAGGDWIKISQIIQQELRDCNVTVVIYKQ